MKLKTFRISLNKSSSTYAPGENVSGVVVIDPGKSEVETQGLLLKFEGNATVHWTEHCSRSLIGEGVNYKGFSNILAHQIYLVGDGDGTTNLSPGETTFPFTFPIPALNIPGTFDGEHGKIKYVLTATLKRTGLLVDCKCESDVEVAPVFDLNLNPMLAKPKELQKWKNSSWLSCARGPLTMRVKLEATGFCLKETFSFLVEVHNGSTQKMDNVTAQLIREITYRATTKTKQSYKELGKKESSEQEVGPDSEVWRGNLTVPPWTIPTRLGGGCEIIDVQYYLKVIGHVSGMGTNLQLEVPVTIGTIPLRNVSS